MKLWQRTLHFQKSAEELLLQMLSKKKRINLMLGPILLCVLKVVMLLAKLQVF